MKSCELIKLLQQVDPSGETECVVGGEDIYFVARAPCYYDGTPCLLIRDPNKAPYWDVVGIRKMNAGDKIKIHTLSALDVIVEAETSPSISIPSDYDALRDEWRAFSKWFDEGQVALEPATPHINECDKRDWARLKQRINELEACCHDPNETI
jgi:hypothetical protein